MSIIKCPECGHQVSNRARTCPSCGVDIAGNIVRCPDCGEVLFKEQKSCPNCHCTINAAAVWQAEEELPSPSLQSDSPSQVAVPVQQPQKSSNSQPPARPRKRSWIAFLVAFVISLIVVFLGIYFYQRTMSENELRAYENAIRSSEPAVLQNFLDIYVDAPQAHRDSIAAHIEALKKVDTDWTNAVMSGRRAELENYMKLHPQSIHNVEAKIKIDSIDWLTALAADTPEAYHDYIMAHEDGAYYDEAHARYEQLEQQKVNADDKRLVADLFLNYYSALAKRDEERLTSTLAPVLTSFLHKEHATKSDVLQYMNRIHEPDVRQITFVPNNDYKIEKTPEGDDSYSYKVEFSVDEKIDRSDESKERFCTFKVVARVTSDCKIGELNMRKVVQ